MENWLNVNFPLNEAQWKTAARCHTNGTYGYLRLCESILLQQLVNYYETVINVPDWDRDASSTELSFYALVEVVFVYKSIQAWYNELECEALDEDESEE